MEYDLYNDVRDHVQEMWDEETLQDKSTTFSNLLGGLKVGKDKERGITHQIINKKMSFIFYFIAPVANSIFHSFVLVSSLLDS